MASVNREDQRCVFIASDWHLGGTADSLGEGGKYIPGTSICRSAIDIVAFIDSITTGAKHFAGTTELVINGDMVDFLAPDPARGYWPVSWQPEQSQIVARLQDIAADVRDANGRGPFEALGDLLEAGCELTIILGNHDVELSLPKVRLELERLLGAKRGRYRFIFDGEAYSRGGLVIEHGNRYDFFNSIDYSLLRQERSMLSRGFAVDAAQRGSRYFVPPMGSEIVVNEINPRLSSGAFLNLLKPEIPAVVPLLLALFPETINGLNVAFRIYGAFRAFRQGMLDQSYQPVNDGRLSASLHVRPDSLEAFLVDELGSEDAKAFNVRSPISGALSGSQATWLSISEIARRSLKVVESVELCTQWLDILTARTDFQRLAQIRTALRKVQEGHTFDRSRESQNYYNAAKVILEVSGNSVVVFGHTHFPKEIVIGQGKYLNAGAWADVARLPAEIASRDARVSDEAIKQFFTDMKGNNIRPYLVQSRTYVKAILGEHGVIAELMNFEQQDAA